MKFTFIYTPMPRYLQGLYKLKKPHKYKGDPNNVVYRSSWERAVFVWCERNEDIVSWSAEEVVVPYFYEVTKRHHRYFVDLWYKTKSGKTHLIEIKPKKETQKPKRPDKSKRYISEALTYVKNQNKWQAAESYATERGWVFEVWTEDTLQAMKILPKAFKPLPKLKPYSKGSKPKR